MLPHSKHPYCLNNQLLLLNSKRKNVLGPDSKAESSFVVKVLSTNKTVEMMMNQKRTLESPSISHPRVLLHVTPAPEHVNPCILGPRELPPTRCHDSPVHLRKEPLTSEQGVCVLFPLSVGCDRLCQHCGWLLLATSPTIPLLS